MASHHPHHYHHFQNPVPTAPITATTLNCCCSCSCHYNHCCTQPHYHSSPPPQQLSIDPLVQALASLLHQQQQLPNLYPSYPNKTHTHKNHCQNLHCQPQNLHFQQLSDDQKTQSVLSSLLQRINTLESSLHHFSNSSASINCCHPSYSLRDAAARVIQTHFRVFLVRRSKTLNQLQDLAFIKSSFSSLKSSISNRTRLNCEVLSHKAMDLLLKLDSIQGGDPMIRDGKRSISRDITRFLEFIDGLAAKSHVNSRKPAKNVRFVRNSNKSRACNASIGYGDISGHRKEVVEKLSDRVDKIHGFSRVCDNVEEDVELEGFQQFIGDDDEEEEHENPEVSISERPRISKLRSGILIKSNGDKPRVKKTVSFDENGNVYKVFSDTHESVVSGDGSDSSDDHGETADCIEIEEGKGLSNGGDSETHGNVVSTQSSEGERNTTRNSRNSDDYEMNVYCHDQDGNLVFSAPVPVKMESRADLTKNMKAVKIVK
ncbi:hypothetical protein JCGZ_19915 [Jatropha curcas]|uniref:BAG domain-containing protein n=1 Tax=Jatropha curcas TaxID=180498 RepID=A0A067JTF3_JATCU|nr:BAG family molecular chaperone regulator 8, chloroplastic [Jatropha curcas]KDP27216.1 hypothetical protein JCGZ_19915 [Jatropha curcas]